MLVLSRAKDERIVINDKITIVIVAIDYDRVRIGIEAPADVAVHRMEVYRALQAAEEAGESAPETSAPRTGDDRRGAS